MDNKTTLIGEKLEQAVQTINVGWAVLPGQGLVRVVETDGFKSGFGLLASVAQLAQDKNYDPEITLRRREVEISLRTYEAGGVTGTDIDMAQGVDTLIA